jgi:hypothetical protein
MEKKNKFAKPIPIQSLFFLHTTHKLDFNPDYQRESVWTKSQKQLLIDSLLIEIDIPKIYFREVARGSFVYEVVDGQQRLRAIFEFLENRFPLSVDSDPVDGKIIAGKYFQDLDISLQLQLQAISLDIVIMNKAYTDDDIDEMFLRLQNGTPLNAAEKRRAVSGNMGTIVRTLADSKVFGLAGFTDKRFAYEDTVAKTLHELLNGTITDIRPVSIKKSYDIYKDLSQTDRSVIRLKHAYSFLQKSFKNKPSPKLKKYALISLGYLLSDMLDDYDLNNYPSEFADCYLDFEKKRILNENLPEESQDSQLAAFTDAARSDSIQDIKYRDEVYRAMIIGGIPQLALKDPTREFTQDQRLLIYLRDGGICSNCGSRCEQDNFHADHKKPHSKGGATSLENGQLLCPECNQKKGSKE